MSSTSSFCIVHCGAGVVPNNSRKQLCSLSVSAVNNALQHSLVSPIEATAAATITLEASPLTNAGIGSNLTAAKNIECDACLMTVDCNRSPHFASVGAVSETAHPIRIAQLLLERQQAERDSPLVAPLTLVGDGARQFADSLGVERTSAEQLITKRALSDFQSTSANLADTVGAIVINRAGEAAVGCSSGGALLKPTGRLGSAAIYGAGGWTESRNDLTVAVAVSGCGEMLIRTQFAKECAASLLLHQPYDERLLAERLVNCFEERFRNSQYLPAELRKTGRHVLAGAIVLVYDRNEGAGEYAWVHNSRHLAVGFGGGREAKPVGTVSVSCGSAVVAQGGNFRLY